MRRIITAVLTAGLIAGGALATPHTSAAAATSATATSESLKAEYTKRLANMTYTKFTKSTSSGDKSSETAIFSTLNTDRARAGSKAIKRSSSLDDMARTYAKKMASTGEFKHNPNLGSEAPAGWRGLGENIAWNDARSNSTGIALYYQWMKSDGHRTNVLNAAWTHVGLGVYIDKNGRHWGVQVFGKYPAGTTPDKEISTITGFSKGITVNPKATVSWKNVKLSNPGKLQKYSGGKWTTVKSLARGTHTVKIKASSSYGKTVKFRIYTPATTKYQSVKTKTVSLKTKAKAKVTGFKATKAVKRKATITWKNVKLTHKGQLQRYTGGKWAKVKNLKKGTQTVKAKAPNTKGKAKYRIVISASGSNTKAASKTISVKVK